MITFQLAGKRYKDGTSAVKNLNLDIREGEFFVLIGPSGCGKTTSLKMVNRLAANTEGSVLVQGKDVHSYNVYELRRKIGYVLQQIALFPHMTVEENIAIVPELKGRNRKEISSRVNDLLEMAGLEPRQYRKKRPAELSGGEQQRVGVMRALAGDPEIILMDEPFSALDPISREKLQEDMLALQQKIRKTILFVTHDMQEAIRLADRICIMNKGEAVQIGTLEEITRHPENEFVREFIGKARSILHPDKLRPMNLAEELNGGADVPAHTVPYDATASEVLEKLENTEEVAVEENGAVIGVISRKALIAELGRSLHERGGSR